MVMITGIQGVRVRGYDFEDGSVCGQRTDGAQGMLIHGKRRSPKGCAMPDVIAQELNHRMEIWRKLKEIGGARSVVPGIIRRLGIYGGAQGIWVDKQRTAQLTADRVGVAVGLLQTGASYADDFSSDGVLYHYPNTGRGVGRDLSEVAATKLAGRLNLPVFVITHSAGNESTRDVYLGWIESWDDRSGLFLTRVRGQGCCRTTRPRLERQIVGALARSEKLTAVTKPRRPSARERQEAPEAPISREGHDAEDAHKRSAAREHGSELPSWNLSGGSTGHSRRGRHV